MQNLSKCRAYCTSQAIIATVMDMEIGAYHTAVTAALHPQDATTSE